MTKLDDLKGISKNVGFFSLSQMIRVFCCSLIFLSPLTLAEEVEEPAAKTTKTDYMQLKPTITTNYQSTNLKYVRTDVSIRVASSMISDIAAHKDPVRDIIIMLLARQDKETLTSSEGLSTIREEAKEEIIAFLESEGAPTDVVDVLFLSFLVE